MLAAPGNPGIAELAELLPIAADDMAGLVAAAARHGVDLVVIGPEGPLVAGLADALRGAGIAAFGPSAAAAQLEGSKAFTKALCDRAAIPTARYRHCPNQRAAFTALADFALPVVIKADGLAAGKGVVIADTIAAAHAAITDMFGGQFGAAGASVVIEEFLTGEEVSLFALTDGTTILPFGSAQDHKRVGEGDTGPNTGGMGAYSPASVLTPALEAAAMAQIVAPTVAALAAAGTPYCGVLFAGLMLTDDGPKLIEYNCRFGDPECQVLMLRHRGDLAALLWHCATGRLADAAPDAAAFADAAAVTVVLAAAGYPAAPVTGGAIGGLEAAAAAGATLFHAGTARSPDGSLTAAGGRVLNIAATGADVGAARDLAYMAAALVDFPGGFCRRDIGWRELARRASKTALE